jgi:hypothetical protein
MHMPQHAGRVEPPLGVIGMAMDSVAASSVAIGAPLSYRAL